MSQIDYQALREAAERAIPAMERLLMLPVDDDLLSEQELKDYGVDIDALNAFKFLTGPETVLALLDERERNQQYIKRRDQENEDIALTVGRLRVELEGKDSKIANLTAERDALREGEMGDARHSNTRAAADIYFQLVEECEIPAGGSLVEYVDDMREKLEAAEKRIAELEAELVSQTYKLNELSGNSPVTPDGWISCSERMPDTKTAVLVAVEFDRKGDWRMKWATYIPGHPDANDGWIIPGASWKPSHWMPLPEPPQEAK
ncbi:TPA: ead/Ea22-like family protein [Escherichia coli]|nr:ead/Ea22-like family protein [Escherichia coli]